MTPSLNQTGLFIFDNQGGCQVRIVDTLQEKIMFSMGGTGIAYLERCTVKSYEMFLFRTFHLIYLVPELWGDFCTTEGNVVSTMKSYLKGHREHNNGMITRPTKEVSLLHTLARTVRRNMTAMYCNQWLQRCFKAH